MTNYLSDIRIDTHGKLAGWGTEVIDRKTGETIRHVCKIEVLIVPDEPVAAKLTLAHVREREQAWIDHEEAICPEVELAPVLAFVQQAIGTTWEVDGESWQYLDTDHLQVTFSRRKENV